MGVLFRIYINALMKGNPFAIGITVVGAVAASVGPFYEGVSKGDPVAIAMMGGVGLLLATVLAVSVVDKINNQPKKQPAPKGGPSRPGAGRVGR